MTTENEYTPLSCVLARTAAELRDLKGRLEKVEEKLETVYFAAPGKLRGSDFETLQEIDLIVQSADAVSVYLAKVAENNASLNTTINTASATKNITLQELAARLNGVDNDVVVCGQNSSVELF